MKNYHITKYQFKNDFCVFYCHTPDSVAFEITMHINTGARDEVKENAGVSHFLEHMMFRGSAKYPNSIVLAKAMESFGGETNAMTGIENTNYWIKGSAEKTLDAIECFSDFFLNPNYADLNIERNVIIQEMFSDFNEDGVSIDTESLGMETLFDHPLGNPIIGTEDSVRNISVEDLEKKRKSFYIPKNCVMTIQTSLPESDVLKKIESCFLKNWENSENILPERSNANSCIPSIKTLRKPINSLRLQNNPDNQFAIKILFPTQGNLSKEVVNITFLQRILDDGICTRLPANIREKFGLVYDISCDTQFFQDIGTFSIDITVSEDSLLELLEKLRNEFVLLLKEPISENEVEHIKYRYLFDLKQIQETPSRLLNRKVTEHFMRSNFSIEDEINHVKSIDSQLLSITIKNIFEASKRAFVLVGPKARKKRELVERFLSVFNN
jgi:predicted Zn-dependent peptidase